MKFKRSFFIQFIVLTLLISWSISCKSDRENTVITESTAKPWAYWWWMGNSVTKKGLDQNLKAYSDAGFGGLHIVLFTAKKEVKNNILTISLINGWKCLFIQLLGQKNWVWVLI